MDIKYRILKTWDDETATWAFRLQIMNEFGTEYESTIYCGDKQWAEKQAAHYQCEIVLGD